MNSKHRQVLFLTVWSFLFVVPLFLKTGPNVCTTTFQEGAHRFWRGASPYMPPKMGDLFHYSPFFAMVYQFFAVMPPKIHALSFALLNCFVFWLGISAWFTIRKDMSKWLWLGLAVCAMELDISVRYQQTNALVTGIILLGLASYRDEKWAKAGFLFALVSNLKIFPVLFAGLLCYPFRKRYVLSLVLTTILLVSLPALVVGPKSAVALHFEQWHAIASDLPTRRMLDLRSAMYRWGLQPLIPITSAIIAATTFLLLIFSRILRSQDLIPWMGLTLTALLLLVPRTESPTFVWMAPLYLLLMVDAPLTRKRYLAVVMFLATFVYTSAWPLKGFFEINYSSKTLGTLALWALTVSVVYRSCTRASVTLGIRELDLPDTGPEFRTRQSPS